MTLQQKSKLNRLMTMVPEGLPVTAAWLKQEVGVSRQLVQDYVKNGWLANPTRGVYVRNPAKLTWLSALLAVQWIEGRKCYPTGESALRLLGFGQYIPMGKGSEQGLGGPERPPLWLDRLELEVSFRYAEKTLFANEELGMTTFPVPGYEQALQIPTAARAILEMLAGVRDEDRFRAAYELFEGMTSLSPNQVQSLLVDCRHIKAKRLFMMLLDWVGHAWGRHLDREALDLGSGKRVVVKGGKLNAKYGVTVPEGFHD